MINIENVDHLGIRVTDRQRSLEFYKILGFELYKEVDFDAVIIVKNGAGHGETDGATHRAREAHAHVAPRRGKRGRL